MVLLRQQRDGDAFGSCLLCLFLRSKRGQSRGRGGGGGGRSPQGLQRPCERLRSLSTPHRTVRSHPAPQRNHCVIFFYLLCGCVCGGVCRENVSPKGHSFLQFLRVWFMPHHSSPTSVADPVVCHVRHPYCDYWPFPHPCCACAGMSATTYRDVTTACQDPGSQLRGRCYC